MNIFPDSIHNLVPYNLRNADNFETINRRTHIFSSSFVPSSVTLWNNLNPEIRSANSLASFKTMLKLSVFPSSDVKSGSL